MADILTFRAQQFGDCIVVINPLSAPLTPPEPIAGLWRTTGTINSDSVNMLYSLEFRVYITRPTRWQCLAVIEAIRQQQGQRGTLIAMSNAAVVLRAMDWVLMSVGDPGLLPARGGKWTRDLPLVFSGATPWSPA